MSIRLFHSTNTSKPKPQARRYPRRTRAGGLEISVSTATAWASRLRGEELHPFYDEPSVWNEIRKRVCPFGVDFADLSEDNNPVYVIVTQFARFQDGYKDMDPKLIPQFEEGERETIARKLLEEEGVEIVGFRTLLTDSNRSFHTNTSKPKPRTRRYPRRTRAGGLEISVSTATAWASRLRGEELHPIYDEHAVWNEIRKRVCPFGVDFADLSEDNNPVYVIVTQFARFDGYKDMDPKLIPQFEEGEREAIARKLLEEEGVDIVGFRTILTD